MARATIIMKDTAEMEKIPDRHIDETTPLTEGKEVTLQDILGAGQEQFAVNIHFPEDENDSVTVTNAELKEFFEYSW